MLGGTSLKLAFRQTGAQRLAGDISTGTLAQLFPSNLEKAFFTIFTMLLTPGGSPPVVLFHLGLCCAVSPAKSPAGPAGVWPTSGARSTATHTWSPSPSPSLNGVFLTCTLIWVGPLQYSNNFNYIFSIVDRTSKWTEAIPLSETSAAACAKALTFYLDFSFWSAQNYHF